MNFSPGWHRRYFLKTAAGCALGAVSVIPSEAEEESAVAQRWLPLWEQSILADARSRACDKEMGEEIGWLISPYLNGFYYGYLATKDVKWVAMLVDWTEAWIKRGVEEPDGFMGWPKGDGGGGETKLYAADSLLGEAMALRPVVLMAAEILQSSTLAKQFGEPAKRFLELAERTFTKWDTRECWRSVKGGGLWIVPSFGIDPATKGWSEGYARRKVEGFSNPANKQNHIACWMLAMFDATKKSIYKARAEQWFQLMKSRIRERGKFLVWNYWEPAGPWDYKPDGAPKHWVGVHPNGGYYAIDVEGIVAAYQHDLVFTKADIDHLVATNRDFMWNQQAEGAKFQRIDGEAADARWEHSPGLLWTGLLPYDATLRKIFVANHKPDSWGGISSTPWFLAKVR